MSCFLLSGSSFFIASRAFKWLVTHELARTGETSRHLLDPYVHYIIPYLEILRSTGTPKWPGCLLWLVLSFFQVHLCISEILSVLAESVLIFLSFLVFHLTFKHFIRSMLSKKFSYIVFHSSPFLNIFLFNLVKLLHFVASLKYLIKFLKVKKYSLSYLSAHVFTKYWNIVLSVFLFSFILAIVL